MAKIFSWQINDSQYAYLTGVNNNKPFVSGRLSEDDYKIVVSKVDMMPPSEYSRQFELLCELCSTEYGYDPTNNGKADYMSFYDTDSLAGRFMIVLEGKPGKPGKDGEKGEKGDPGEPGAKPDKPIPYIPVTAYCSTRDRDVPPEKPKKDEIKIIWDDEGGTFSFITNGNWFLHDSEANENDGDGTKKSIIWQSSAIFNDKEIVSDWTEPFRITGDSGEPGSDGNTLEFIYTRRTFPMLYPESEIPESDPDVDEYRPEGWDDSPSGVDETWKYEYVCQRRKGIDGLWGPWSKPTIWSKWGTDGKDGDGVEYVYCLAKREETPGFALHNVEAGMTEEEFMDSDAYQTDGIDEYLPKLIGVEGSDIWSDNPGSLSEEKPHLWVLIRKRRVPNGETKAKWGPFDGPKLWSTYGQKGEQGIEGLTVFQRKCYQASSNDAPPHVESGNIDPGFGWGISIPHKESEQIIWCIETFYKMDLKQDPPRQVLCFDDGEVERVGDDGNPLFPSWSTPYVYEGRDGKNAVHIQEEIFMCLPEEDGVPPTPKSFDNKIDWDVPDGWSTYPDGLSPDRPVCYISIRRREGKEHFHKWMDWEDPQFYSRYGKDGSKGEDAISLFKSTVFLRSNKKPDKPEGGSFADPLPRTSIDEGVEWEDGIPDGKEILWSSVRTFSTGYALEDDEGWSSPAKMADTNDFEVIYGVATADTKTLPPLPIDEGFQNFNGWFDNDVDLPAEEIYFMATSSAKNGVWGKWVVTKIKAEDGQSIKIKGTFKTLEEFKEKIAGEDLKRPPEDGDYSSAYIVAGDLWVWDMINEEWTNLGQFTGDDGIALFKSTVFIRSNEKPKTPEGGSFSDPYPRKSISDGIKWEDGIPDGKEILWSSVRTFSTDKNFKDEGWSSPAQMTDTANFEVIYGTQYAKMGKDDLPKLPITKEGFTNENGWYDNESDLPVEDIYYMATASAKNGVWSGWSISKVKGENGQSFKIKATFEKLEDFKREVAGEELNIPPEDGDYSSAYIVAGDLYIWNITAARWENVGSFTAVNGTDGKDGSSTEFVFFTTNTYEKPDHMYIPQRPREDEAAEREYAYTHDDYKPCADAQGLTKWSDEPQGVDKNNKYEWVKKREKTYDETNKVSRWSDFGGASLFAKWGENGKDGEDKEYIYCYTKTDEKPGVATYVNNSSDAQKPDFCPKIVWSGDTKDISGDTKNGELYWMDNAKGVSAEWQYGWEVIRKRKASENTDKNDPNSYTYEWEPYLSDNVTLHAKWGRDGDPGRPGVAGVPGITYEMRYMLGAVSETNPDEVHLSVPEVVNGEFTGNNKDYILDSPEWKEYWESTLYPGADTPFKNTRYLDKTRFPLYTESLKTGDNYPYVFFVQSRIVTKRTETAEGLYNDVELLEEGHWEGPYRVTGAQGIQGPEGPVGPILYSAGVYGLGKKYYVDDVKKPYVLDPDDREFYYLNKGNYNAGALDDDTGKEFWYADADGSEAGAFNTPSKSVSNGFDYWVKMEQFDVILANVGIFRSALVGSGVFYGDWFYSQNGTIDGATSTSYEKFLDVKTSYDENGNLKIEYKEGSFKPVMAINLKDGSGWFANGKISWGANGDVKVDGVLKDGGNAEGTVGGSITTLNTRYGQIDTTVTNLGTQVSNMGQTINMLNSLGSDGYITIYEIESLKNLKTQLEIEYTNICEKADNIENLGEIDTEDEYFNFNSAYSSAYDVLEFYTNRDNFTDDYGNPVKQIAINDDYSNIEEYYRVRERFQNVLEIAVIKKNSSAGGVDEEEWNKLKDEFAEQFGFSNYDELVDNAITNGETLIKGGFINTKLISAENLIADTGLIGKLDVRELNTTGKNNFINGTISIKDNDIKVHDASNPVEILRITGDALIGLPEDKFFDTEYQTVFNGGTYISRLKNTYKIFKIASFEIEDDGFLHYVVVPKIEWSMDCVADLMEWESRLTYIRLNMGVGFEIHPEEDEWTESDYDHCDYGTYQLFDSDLQNMYKIIDSNTEIEGAGNNGYDCLGQRIFYNYNVYDIGDHINLYPGKYNLVFKVHIMDWVNPYQTGVYLDSGMYLGQKSNILIAPNVNRCDVSSEGFRYIIDNTKYITFNKGGKFEFKNGPYGFKVSNDGIWIQPTDNKNNSYRKLGVRNDNTLYLA